jgi:3-oxoacyl-[acyl-carrier protein] reductase
MNINNNKKTVLVTGSTRGIGKAIAIKFAKEGYNVVINGGHDEVKLLETKSEIEQYKVSCLAYLGDMGSYDKAKELFLLIKEHFEHIDVLVNNAGISYIGLLTDMAPEDWNKIITTNLTSVYNCCSLAIPDMVKQKYGKIINISSVWGNVGASCEVAYSASKGGMNAFTKALGKELAPSNIQVNAIACGAIDTEMNNFLTDEELLELTNEIPSGRLGKREEVADLVYQLTQNNSYLTGQIISLDGGWI